MVNYCTGYEEGGGKRETFYLPLRLFYHAVEFKRKLQMLENGNKTRKWLETLTISSSICEKARSNMKISQ